MRTRYLYAPNGGALVAKYVDGVCVFRDESFIERDSTGFQVMKDIKPYRSMIDGSEITSRSRHREHLRNNGCFEVGNDSSLTRPPKPHESPPGLKEKVIRAVNDYQENERRKKWH